MNRTNSMTQTHPSRALPRLSMILMLPLSACSSIDLWTEGVWAEECIESDSFTECDWAPGLFEPDEPHTYIIRDFDEDGGDDQDEVVTVAAPDDLLLSDAIALYDASTDDLWTYCNDRSLQPYCDLPIQIFQPDHGLEDSVAAICGSLDDAWIWGWSEGLLLRQGEAVFNHLISIQCNGSLPEEDSHNLSCSYSSVLKLQ